jgi:hypothetical protein
MVDSLEKEFISCYISFQFIYFFFYDQILNNTSEAEYAHRVYSKGALLVNWVAVFSAFPVIYQDIEHLSSKGNYQNYDAHFIPVFSPDHPNTPVYHACKQGQQHQYTELVVFDSSQILPRFIVELQQTLVSSPTPSSMNINDLLTVLMKYQLTLSKKDTLYALIDEKLGTFPYLN